MNPALAARAFLFSWPVIMTTWVQPGDWAPIFGSSADAVTSATPLASLHQSALPAESLMSLFLGKTGGCLGETSALLLLLGGLYLVSGGSSVCGFPLLIWVPWPFSPCSFPGGTIPLWMGSHLLSGGLMLGAWFMATDYVTSPVTGWGADSLRRGLWLYHRPHSVFRLLSGGGQLCHFDDERLCGPPGQGRAAPAVWPQEKGGCKMKNRKSGLTAVVTLFLITAVMAGLLALVNSVTAGPIAAAQREKDRRGPSLGVLREGVELGEQLESFPDETGLVEGVYKTSDGYVVEVTPSGYGGEIHMVVGVDGACTVTGIRLSRIRKLPAWGPMPPRTMSPDGASGSNSWGQGTSWPSPRTAAPSMRLTGATHDLPGSDPGRERRPGLRCGAGRRSLQ